MHKTYELISLLPAQTVLYRIGDLLAKERVKYKILNSSVITIQTPLVLLGLDPRLYSRNNWTGLNPFAYISGIEVRCEANDNGLTRVVIHINRFRAFVWVACCVACSSLAASAMPLPEGAIVGFGLPFAAWFGIVSFVGGYLVKKETVEHLKDGNISTVDRQS